jgi:hypothetical protein
LIYDFLLRVKAEKEKPSKRAMLALIRKMRGSLKPKPDTKSFAEMNRKEKEGEERKLARFSK